MRAWAAAGVAGFACFVLGCATPQMTATDLAGRAAGNILEAQQSLAGKMVIVSGVVSDTTLASRDRVELTGAYSRVAAVRKEERVPLVLLQPGSVLCYFEPHNISDVSQVRQGDPVEFECEVQYFKDVNRTVVSVLAGCRRNK
jgi:hypothetical protein